MIAIELSRFTSSFRKFSRKKSRADCGASGEALPPEADLCATYGVSRTVVRQALAILEQDRQIIRVRGSGTFVAKPKVEQRAGGFSRLLASANPDNASRWVREYQICRMETEPNSPMSIRET